MLDLATGSAADRMLTITHDDLLDDPEATVERCLDFLGEPPAPECMRPLRELRALAQPGQLGEEHDPELVQRARAAVRRSSVRTRGCRGW